MSCNCETSGYIDWDYKRKCLVMDPDTGDKLKKALDRIKEEVQADLDGKKGGSMELESYYEWENDPKYSYPIAVCYERYATTSDWFDYRSLKATIEPDPEEKECEDWPDMEDGEKQEPVATNSSCDCTKTDNVMEIGPPKAVDKGSKDTGKTENRNLNVTIKVTWEESSGRIYGKSVPCKGNYTPTKPDLNYKGKSKEKSTNATIKYKEVEEKYAQRWRFSIRHSCP